MDILPKAMQRYIRMPNKLMEYSDGSNIKSRCFSARD